MSRRDAAFAEGRLAGIRDSGWQCGDCGNSYDATVDSCPNLLLDQALADAGQAQAAGQPPAAATRAVREPHRPGCPCEAGPCCPWMGDCACQ